MAAGVQAIPGYALTPSSVKATLPTNYITDFNFLKEVDHFLLTGGVQSFPPDSLPSEDQTYRGCS